MKWRNLYDVYKFWRVRQDITNKASWSHGWYGKDAWSKNPFSFSRWNGRKNVPADWIDKIANHYGLTIKEKDELQKAVDESRTQYKIAIKDSGINQRRAAMQFARSFDELDDDTAIKILKLLKDKEDRNN